MRHCTRTVHVVTKIGLHANDPPNYENYVTRTVRGSILRALNALKFSDFVANTIIWASPFYLRNNRGKKFGPDLKTYSVWY